MYVPCVLLSVTAFLFSKQWDNFELTSWPSSFLGVWAWLAGLVQSWILRSLSRVFGLLLILISNFLMVLKSFQDAFFLKLFYLLCISFGLASQNRRGLRGPLAIT